MQILFKHKSQFSPKLSVVLFDWSCRDSLHMLDYLNNQAVSREIYEILWIEYYDRRSLELEKKLKICAQNNKYPIIDKWIVMEMPQDTYYHKHLMYNLGIIFGRGDIITFCDSDAVVKPTFIESIIKEFEKDPNIILHMDEVRNINRKFYPFNNPTIEEIISDGSKNFISGKTTGIIDQDDPLHTRNYGACMSATRENLIKIGGADEHIDYLGHICGPYDMTFRLVNDGKQEVWHQEEFLYHTWHPGTNGCRNYIGPNDGRGMSTTAISIISSGRILPLLENEAIQALRLDKEKTSYEDLLAKFISGSKIKAWKISWSKLNLNLMINIFPTNLGMKILLGNKVILIIIKQLFSKTKNNGGKKVMPKGLLFQIKLTFVLSWRLWRNYIYIIKSCISIIDKLVRENVKEVAFYGSGKIAELLYILIKDRRIKLSGVYDSTSKRQRFFDSKVSAFEDLSNYNGKVIIASLAEIMEKSRRLQDLGIKKYDIVRLQ